MRAGCIWGSVAGLGLVLVIVGVVMVGMGPKIVKDMVKKTIDITDEGSDGYKYFVGSFMISI